MTTIVYGVSTGDWSSYHVCAIFTSKDAGREYVSARMEADTHKWWRCFNCDAKTQSRVEQVYPDDSPHKEHYDYVCASCGRMRGHMDTGHSVEEFDLDPEVALP